jgi:hypothetical protein
MLTRQQLIDALNPLPVRPSGIFGKILSAEEKSRFEAFYRPRLEAAGQTTVAINEAFAEFFSPRTYTPEARVVLALDRLGVYRPGTSFRDYFDRADEPGTMSELAMYLSDISDMSPIDAREIIHDAVLAAQRPSKS